MTERTYRPPSAVQFTVSSLEVIDLAADLAQAIIDYRSAASVDELVGMRLRVSQLVLRMTHMCYAMSCEVTPDSSYRVLKAGPH